jgi:hypothetical protein
MGHTYPNTALHLQQDLDRFARCVGMLLIIGFQPGAYRSAYFGRLTLPPLVQSVFTTSQHPLSQPIRGCSAHLDAHLVNGVAPRVALEHGPRHLCFSMRSVCFPHYRFLSPATHAPPESFRPCSWCKPESPTVSAVSVADLAPYHG